MDRTNKKDAVVSNEFIVCNMHDVMFSACQNLMKLNNHPATAFDAILWIDVYVMIKFVHTITVG